MRNIIIEISMGFFLVSVRVNPSAIFFEVFAQVKFTLAPAEMLRGVSCPRRLRLGVSWIRIWCNYSPVIISFNFYFFSLSNFTSASGTDSKSSMNAALGALSVKPQMKSWAIFFFMLSS